MTGHENSGLFCDSHAHLNDQAFADDLPQVIERALDSGVGRIVSVGFDENSSRLAVDQSKRWPCLLATVGVHPHDAEKFADGTLERLEALAAEPGAAAIGETGLDYYYMNSPAPKQKKVFEAHLDLAERSSLPAVIHCRKAYPDLIAILRERSRSRHVPWLVHCFSGDSSDLEELIGLDCYFSVGGVVTFRNFKKQEQIVRIPDQRLLLETDSPYLAPHPMRGQRNEPAFLVHIAAVVAWIRGMPDTGTLARLTWSNFEELFGAAARGR